jgi:hypothetical protein
MPSNTTANVKASKLTTKAYKDKPKAEVSIIKKKEKCRAFYGRFDKPTTLWALALQTKYRKGKKSSHRGTPQRSQPADRAGLAAVWLPSHQGDHQPLYVFSLSHRITNPNNASDSDDVPMQQGSIVLAAVGATGTYRIHSDIRDTSVFVLVLFYFYFFIFLFFLGRSKPKLSTLARLGTLT